MDGNGGHASLCPPYTCFILKGLSRKQGAVPRHCGGDFNIDALKTRQATGVAVPRHCGGDFNIAALKARQATGVAVPRHCGGDFNAIRYAIVQSPTVQSPVIVGVISTRTVSRRFGGCRCTPPSLWG